MKKITKLLIAIIILTLGLQSLPIALAETSSLQLYVAADGDDSNEGTINSPFATLERARDKIREIKKSSSLPSGGITVNLRGGEYNRLESFYLTEEDSGTKDCPITYRAYPGEYVDITGGFTAKKELWKVTDDEETLKRIPEEAHGKVYEIDLGALGYTKEQIGRTNYRGHYSTGMSETGYPNQPNTPHLPKAVEIFENDEPQTIARYPNEGWIYIKKVVKACVQYWDNPTDESGFIIQYEDPHLDRWKDVKDARLYGFFMVDWADCTVDIKEVNTRARTIESAQATAFGVHAADGIGGRYIGFNMLEELDVAGEYYTDPDTLKLYYYPKTDINTAKLQISISTSDMFILKKCDYITFKDMNISATRGSIFGTDHTNNITIDGCTLYNSAKKVITISEGKNNRVINCEIFNTNGGISISSRECLEKLEWSGNSVINCKIHDFARLDPMYNSAINLVGSGNYVAHNEIYNGPHFGIFMQGTANTIIEKNNIYGVLKDTSDAGVIYWGGSHYQQGIIIRNNYIHDNGHEQVNLTAIYQDSGVGGTEIYGNVITNLPYGIGVSTFGSSNNVYNNIFIGMERASMWLHYTANMIGTAFHEVALKEARESPYKNEIWREKYPYLVDQLDREGEDYFYPINNIYKNNIAIDCPGDDIYPEHKNGAKEYVATVTASKAQIPYTMHEDGSLTIDQDAIKEKIPEWKHIVMSDMGTSGTIGNKYWEETVVSGGERIEIEGSTDSTNTGAVVEVSYKDKIKNAVVLAVGTSNAFVNGDSVKIDKNNYKVIPVIKQGRTLLPVRFISESFGYEVEWNESTRTVTLKSDDNTVEMIIGDNRLFVNGEAYEMDTSAIIMEGRTLIPLRALCEKALNKKVFWDNKGLIVVSNTENILNSKSDVGIIESIISDLKK